MKRQSCCLAVLPDLHAAELACLELHLGNSKALAISMLTMLEVDSASDDFFRVQTIGTITCRGSVARILNQQSIVRGGESWKMSELLSLIGIPAHHENIYGQALKSGLVVLVLHGNGRPLRQGCQILDEISLGKPVLYLI